MSYKLVKQLLFKLPPETAHWLTLYCLKVFNKLGLLKFFIKSNTSLLEPIRVMGLKFDNPVGLAAGFDKNAEFIDELFTLGFGFVEVGTVTPQPQSGSNKPRLFRLLNTKAIINRMGFNNKGIDYVCKKLKYRRKRGILGVNIGKNKDTPLSQAGDDYAYCLERIYSFADYVVINISSPNTPGLREMQSGNYLIQLLCSLKKKQQLLTMHYQKYVPLVLKISPDLTVQELEHLAYQVIKYKFDGVIATNTTISRNYSFSKKDLSLKSQPGGLSGAPIYHVSNNVLRYLYPILQQANIPLIGVGGILSAENALRKFEIGARLVQLYSGLVYVGPALIEQIIYLYAKKK